MIHKIKKYIFLLAVIFCADSIKAQVYFNTCPKELELIPRDPKINSAELSIVGFVNDPSYNQMEITLYKNGSKSFSRKLSLSFIGGKANFNYKSQLAAGKFSYDIAMSFTGSATYNVKINHVVVGDLYIIQGQSNAVANSYYGLANTKYNDSFIRSFGTSSYDANACLADTTWHYVNGDNYYDQGSVGQWGLVMAKRLLDSFGIPIAIVNGAVGGTYVSQHQRYNPQPENLYTIYGRLLYRIRKAKVENKIRAILYFQGESDGTQGKIHDSLFKILYADWKRDYKGVQQNYLVQVRGGGCGSPTAEMLEIQRQFEYSLNRLRVISTNGLNGHDGCHYWFSEGYELLGKQFSALLGRDLYGSLRKTNVNPPSVQRVWYNNSTHTELMIEMRDPIDSIFVDTKFQNLFFLTGDAAITIVSGKVQGNRVYLGLNQGTCNKLYLSYMSVAGTAPWVKNNLKMGLIGFHLIPIERTAIKPVYVGCPNTFISLGEDSVPGYKYAWKNIQSGKTYTTAKINPFVTQNQSYRLIRQNKVMGCSNDTFYVQAITDKTPAPKLGNDTILCAGAKLDLTITNIYAKVVWQQAGNQQTGLNFTVDTTGLVKIFTESNLGCKGSDSIGIQYKFPDIKLPVPFSICKGLDTLITVKTGFASYSWNKGSFTGPKFRAFAGKIYIDVIDSFGCKANDSSEVHNFAMKNPPFYSFEICTNETKMIFLPSGYVKWSIDGVSKPDSILLKGKGLRKLQLTDPNGCLSYDTVKLKERPTPEFSLGPDTSICEGKSFKFTCNSTVLKYTWNNIVSYSNTFISNRKGPVICSIINSVGCHWEDTVELNIDPLPAFAYSVDTTICSGKFWTLYFSGPYTYFINNTRLDSLCINKAGLYNVNVMNATGCENMVQIAVKTINCISNISNVSQSVIAFYPNPANQILFVDFYPSTTRAWIYDATGREIMEFLTLGHTEINISNLSSGMYFIRTDIETFRFIKE